MRFFVGLLIIFTLSANVQSEESPVEIKISVAYKLHSYQNPWEPPKTHFEKISAIQIAKGELLGIGKKGSIPEFAEIESDGSKLRLDAYDPDTGLSLFSSKPFVVRSKIFSLEDFQFETCKNKLLLNFLVLKDSVLPVRVYQIQNKKKINTDLMFQFEGKYCGIQVENSLLDLEYVRRFLQERKIGRVFPHAGLSVHFDLTPDEKKYYFQNGNDGVIVEKVFKDLEMEKTFSPLDRIIAVNHILIKGTVTEKVNTFYNSIFFSNDQLKKIGDRVFVTLLKKGKKVTVSSQLKQYFESLSLVPERFFEGGVKYFIEGGVVFTELTGSYLKESGLDYRRKSHKKLLYIYEHYKDKTHPFRDRIVIVSRILPHKFNQEMTSLEDEIVQKANGENVRSITHLFEIFRKSKKEVFLEFANGEFFLFSKEELVEINANIKKLYSLNHLNNLEE